MMLHSLGDETRAVELACFFGEVSCHQFGGIQFLGVSLHVVVDGCLCLTLKSLASGENPGEIWERFEDVVMITH